MCDIMMGINLNNVITFFQIYQLIEQLLKILKNIDDKITIIASVEDIRIRMISQKNRMVRYIRDTIKIFVRCLYMDLYVIGKIPQKSFERETIIVERDVKKGILQDVYKKDVYRCKDLDDYLMLTKDSLQRDDHEYVVNFINDVIKDTIFDMKMLKRYDDLKPYIVAKSIYIFKEFLIKYVFDITREDVDRLKIPDRRIKMFLVCLVLSIKLTHDTNDDVDFYDIIYAYGRFIGGPFKGYDFSFSLSNKGIDKFWFYEKRIINTLEWSLDIMTPYDYEMVGDYYNLIPNKVLFKKTDDGMVLVSKDEQLCDESTQTIISYDKNILIDRLYMLIDMTIEDNIKIDDNIEETSKYNSLTIYASCVYMMHLSISIPPNKIVQSIVDLINFINDNDISSNDDKILKMLIEMDVPGNFIVFLKDIIDIDESVGDLKNNDIKHNVMYGILSCTLYVANLYIDKKISNDISILKRLNVFGVIF
jgi:hypothetical protein